MSTVPFAPSTILRLINASLPQDGNAQPQLKNPQEALAAFTHACMLSVGFRLIGLNEDDRLEASSDETNPKPLPSHWASTNGSYGFRYSHTQSSMQYMIKVNRLGGKTVIMGLGLGDDKPTSVDIVTKDFTNESFFPYIAEQRNLEGGFISENRMTDLANLIKTNIVQKLVPGLHKPGYEEDRTDENRAGGQQQSQPQQPRQQPRSGTDDPLRVPRPYGDFPRGSAPIPAGGEPMPGFDDEYEILHRSGGGGYGYPAGGRNPLSIGADDLNPPGLGPNPPLRGPFFGEGGIGMGGMHPTPDHPMFGGRGGSRMTGDPRAPPGARYDPVGPGDEPMGGLRGPRGPGGPGGGIGGQGPFNPFSRFGSRDFM